MKQKQNHLFLLQIWSAFLPMLIFSSKSEQNIELWIDFFSKNWFILSQNKDGTEHFNLSKRQVTTFLSFQTICPHIANLRFKFTSSTQQWWILIEHCAIFGYNEGRSNTCRRIIFINRCIRMGKGSQHQDHLFFNLLPYLWQQEVDWICGATKRITTYVNTVTLTFAGITRIQRALLFATHSNVLPKACLHRKPEHISILAFQLDLNPYRTAYTRNFFVVIGYRWRTELVTWCSYETEESKSYVNFAEASLHLPELLGI